MKKVAVVLSGCGVFDGAELHESILSLYFLEKYGATYQCLAPEVAQTKVINHLNQEAVNENRQVLTEAARIARGDIKAINTVNPDDFVAALYPGGFGAAMNLSSFAGTGADYELEPSVLTFAKAMAAKQKAQAFMCIAPTLIPKVYDAGVALTIGDDEQVAAVLEQLGARHIVSKVNDIVVDVEHKVVTTPAYMLGKNISEVAEGIEKLVSKLMELA